MGEREITARSDVYALGCVLYEMLVGEPPFTGPTAQAIVAKVVTEEPRALRPKRHTIPANVEAATMTALEKLPADRFASAAEFAAALGEASYGTERVTATTTAAARRDAQRRGRYLPAVLAALGGLALGAALLSMLRSPVSAPVTRYGLSLPPDQEPVRRTAGDPLAGRVSDRLRGPGRAHDANLDQATGPLRSFSAPGDAWGDQLHLVSRRRGGSRSPKAPNSRSSRS